MKWKKRLLRTLLAALIIFDLLLFFQARRHGWPAFLSGQPLGDGRVQVDITAIPLSAVDCLLGALLVGFEGIVVYGNWRIGRTVAGTEHKAA